MTLAAILADLNHAISHGACSGFSAGTSAGSSASPAAGQDGQNRRPFVVISYAQSLDGCLTPMEGTPYPLSGDAALKVTHGIRSQCDGLIAGIGTVLADDPSLTTRHGFNGDPEPIILDSRLRFPLRAKLLHQPVKPLVATLAPPADGAATRKASMIKHKELEQAGAKVWRFAPTAKQRIPLPELLTRLYQERGIRSVMVEGGAKVIAEFLTQGLCDYLIVTVAPIFLATLNSVSLALDAKAPLPKLTEMRHCRIGKDLLIWGTPIFEASAAKRCALTPPSSRGPFDNSSLP